MDTQFLEEMLADAQQNKHLVDETPKCQVLYARVVHLYLEIAGKALQNEKSI